MRIAFIAPFGLKAKGTASARLLPLAEALTERGHKIRVIVPPWDDPPGSPDLSLTKPRLEFSGKFEILTLPLRPAPLVVSLPVRLALAARAFKPNVVHVFKPKAYSGLSALLLNLGRQPFVLDTDDWEGSGGWNDRNPYSTLQKRLFAWQERNLPRRATAVTVASRTLESQVWGFGVAPERVCYLPNGVSSQKYAGWRGIEVEEKALEWRIRLGLDGKTVLLAYTRFAEFQPERLLRLFQAILGRLSEEETSKLHLLVVGGGFFKEEAHFKQMAAPYGLADKITLTGQAVWQDLPALLRVGDIALYPFDDNLINRARCSVKFLELMLAERPIVAEAVGELCEYLRHGEGGFLTPTGDEAAFAAATTKLIELSQNACREMGQKGAVRLWQDYNWNYLVERIEKLYLKNFKIL
jgi:glycosyltransferase involved in cell wall biosynthesis